MHILVAVAGSEPDAFWNAVRELVPGQGTLELLHVIDEGPRHEVEWQFLRRPGRPEPSRFEHQAREAETAGARAILTEASSRIGRAAAATVRSGRPEREIVERARETEATLVVVAARPRPGPTPPEPKSVGHVARFVVDHAPCPVLLVRLR